MLGRLLQERGDQLRGAADACRRERLGDGLAPAVRRVAYRLLVEEVGPHHVHDHIADGEGGAAQFGDTVGGLLDRHLLEQGDQMHRGLGGLEDAHHRLGLIVYRADPGQAGDFVVDVQETGDAAGRRRVHHHVVVDVTTLPVPAAYGLAGLARQQHVAHARRDGRREVDRAELLERAARAAELVEHLEVVEKRTLGVDGQRVHLAAARGDGDLSFLVRKGFRLEELGDALPSLDLHEEGALSLGREGEREGRGHRGLTGTALAADDLEPAHVFEPNQSPGVLRTRLPAGCVTGRHTGAATVGSMTKWEYATVPLLVHATKQILDTWGEDGWELVQVVPGPNNPEQLVAYLKREKTS